MKELQTSPPQGVRSLEVCNLCRCTRFRKKTKGRARGVLQGKTKGKKITSSHNFLESIP